MIIVKLWGGLGNQMFQYAAARRLSLKNNTEVGLDLSWFKITHNQDSTRFFELDNFVLSNKVTKNPEDMQIIQRNPSNFSLKKLFRIKTYKPDRFFLIKEQEYCLNKQVLKASDQTYLEGNWTTEKYFLDVKPRILSDFCWIEKPTKKNSELLSELKANPNSISLHIRRGDFLNKNTLEHHGILNLEYYSHAEKEIRKVLKKPHFFVFSDDMKWAKQNLKLKSKMSFISHNKKGIDDMRIMKECRHAVIANSTFSWWAAWLNTNPKKIVIAPKMWLAEPNVNTSDVIPSNWKKI